MKLILLKDVKGKGFKGDVVEVSQGYAQNFLIPGRMGVPATAKALNDIKAQEAKAARAVKKEGSSARLAASKIEGASVRLETRVNGEGGLYAAVSERDVLKALKAGGFSVSGAKVVFSEQIKEAGEFDVVLEFNGGLEASFRLIVEDKGV